MAYIVPMHVKPKFTYLLEIVLNQTITWTNIEFISEALWYSPESWKQFYSECSNYNSV